MADEGRSSKKRKRAKRRGADKNKDSTSNLPHATQPSSQDIVVSAPSDGKKSQRVSGSSSFLDKVRLLLETNLVLESVVAEELQGLIVCIVVGWWCRCELVCQEGISGCLMRSCIPARNDFFFYSFTFPSCVFVYVCTKFWVRLPILLVFYLEFLLTLKLQFPISFKTELLSLSFFNLLHI